jgi:hypothetical protein
MGKKNIQIVVIALIAFVIICFIVGLNRMSYNRGYLEGQKQTEAKYQEKIAEIFPPMPEPEEIFSVFGTIDEIKDKTIVLKAESVVSNPFEEVKAETKRIQVNDNTEFVKEVEKTPEEIQKEEELFAKALEENIETDIMPPMPFKEVSISFPELKEGDRINVEAEENIKDKVEFLAKKVILTFN